MNGYGGSGSGGSGYDGSGNDGLPPFGEGGFQAAPPPAAGIQYQPLQPGDLAVGACFAAGWDFFKRELALVYLTGIVAFLASAAIGMAMLIVFFVIWKMAGMDASVFLNDGGSQNSVRFSTNLFSIPFNCAAFIVIARAMRGEQMSPLDVLKGFKRFFAILASGILMTLAFYFGLIFLIVPGVIIGMGLCWAPDLVVDRGLGVMESLKASWNMMSGYKANLFWLCLVLFFFNVLGVLALCLGLLVTIPVTACVWVYFYNRVADSRLGPVTTAMGERAL